MTRLLLIKLLRDLRTSWARMVMMVVAIGVSLLVFSTVLYSRSVISREISRSYASTNPASATLVLESGIPSDQATAMSGIVRSQPGILDATLRTQVTVQVQSQSSSATPLQLFVAAPDDPMRMSSFKVERDSWPPPPGELLIERDALALLNLKVGDTVNVKTPGGKHVPLKVSGYVHDPSLAPALQELKGYGFISAESLPLLGEQAGLRELKIQVGDEPGQTVPSRNRETIAATARNLGAWLEQTQGRFVQEIQVPTPYEHPHQGQMNTTLLAMVVFGALSVALSALLVATMLNGLLTQQIPQIGMLKAIGARSGRVLQLYLAMILVVALAATALAFVPGLLLARGYATMILKAMPNMDAASLAVPWWTYAAVVGAGVVLPLLMALVPLVRASRRTVREALDDRGVDGQGASATRFHTWLGRLGGLDRTLLMGLRNMFRRRSRLLLSVGLLAMAGTLFIGGLSTMASLQAVPMRAQTERGWDVEVMLTRSMSAATVTNIVAKVPGVTAVEPWTRAQTGIADSGKIGITRTYPDQGHGSVSVEAMPPGSLLLNPPPLLEGRWLRPGDTDAVVVNQIARAYTIPGLHVGDTIQLRIGGRPTTWHVVGIAKEVFVGSGAYVTTPGFAQATGQPDQTNVLRIQSDRHDPQGQAAVADAVERALTAASIGVAYSTPVSRFEAISVGHMAPMISVVLAIAFAMAVVGWIGLASTMSANVLERTREFGVMHAIGASAASVRRIVVSEGVFTAMASFVAAVLPAVALTAGLCWGLGNMVFFTPLPFQISSTAVLIWVVTVVAGAALATLAPAARASRLTVREALAYL